MTKKEIIELIEKATKESEEEMNYQKKHWDKNPSEDNFITYYSKKQVFNEMQFLLKQVKGAK